MLVNSLTEKSILHGARQAMEVFVKKRFRFTGRERDEESGLYLYFHR